MLGQKPQDVKTNPAQSQAPPPDKQTEELLNLRPRKHDHLENKQIRTCFAGFYYSQLQTHIETNVFATTMSCKNWLLSFPENWADSLKGLNKSRDGQKLDRPWTTSRICGTGVQLVEGTIADSWKHRCCSRWQQAALKKYIRYFHIVPIENKGSSRDQRKNSPETELMGFILFFIVIIFMTDSIE